MRIVNLKSEGDIQKALKRLFLANSVNAGSDPFWRLGHLNPGFTIELWNDTVKGAYVDSNGIEEPRAIPIRVYFRLRHKETENGFSVKGIIYPSFLQIGVLLFFVLLTIVILLKSYLIALLPFIVVVVLTVSLIRMEKYVLSEIKRIFTESDEQYEE